MAKRNNENGERKAKNRKKENGVTKRKRRKKMKSGR
jgi:hypothetical protein